MRPGGPVIADFLFTQSSTRGYYTGPRMPERGEMHLLYAAGDERRAMHDADAPKEGSEFER